MKFYTGQGMYVFVPPAAVCSIANYNESNGPWQNQSQVFLINGSRFLVKGDAAELYAQLTKELTNG